MVQGTGEDYPLVRKWDIESGSFFDESMVRSAEPRSASSGPTSRKIFSKKAKTRWARRSASPACRFSFSASSNPRANRAASAAATTSSAFPIRRPSTASPSEDHINSIDVSAVSADKTTDAQNEITDLLRIRHRIPEGGTDDFIVRNMAEIAEGAAEATGILTILLGSIASISLLVGGIGIMNIMLVSVTERIREIGIRMSIGARERDILLQFLAEAIVLSLLGGILGIGLGVGVSKLLKYIPIFSSITTMVSWTSVLLAFVFSGSVGIFFGFYPARKASKLDPIEALRYE